MLSHLWFYLFISSIFQKKKKYIYIALFLLFVLRSFNIKKKKIFPSQETFLISNFHKTLFRLPIHWFPNRFILWSEFFFFFVKASILRFYITSSFSLFSFTPSRCNLCNYYYFFFFLFFLISSSFL